MNMKLKASLLTIAFPTLAAIIVTAAPRANAQTESKAARSEKAAADKFAERLHNLVDTSLNTALTTLEALGPEIERAVAQVDVTEIRETVRRALEDADRRGSFSFNLSTSETNVKGNPYSARETREFKQTLSDGTQINRVSTRLLARDGEGRTRQELRQTDGSARVFINDPVAKRAHIIDPQRRMACSAPFDGDAINDCFVKLRGDWQPLGFVFSAGRNGIPMMTSKDDVQVNVRSSAKIIDLTHGQSAGGAGRTFSWSSSGPGRVEVSPDGRSVTLNDMPAPPSPPSPPTAPTPPTPPTPPNVRTPLTDAAKGVKDAKLVREKTNAVYEGLKVDVDRSVETIPAGAMGNNRAIETINERFFSPDLKMMVYSKRSDPRSGEFIYRISEIRRSEPDAAQFQIPSGFAQSEGKSR